MAADGRAGAVLEEMQVVVIIILIVQAPAMSDKLIVAEPADSAADAPTQPSLQRTSA